MVGGRVAGIGKDEAPLVGRAEELAKLVSGLNDALKGNGKTIIVEGAAGIGKTKLLERVASEALGKGFAVLRGTGQPNGAHPYQLLEEALSGSMGEPLVPGGAEARFSELFAVSQGGVLLAQASAGGGIEVDSDILAGMLTAVQSFVQDSFGRAGDDGAASSPGLKRLEYKQKKLLIEYGESFYLAGVIEGREHEGMQAGLETATSRLGREFGKLLANWDGSMERVRGMKDELENLLRQRWRVLRKPKEVNVEAERWKICERGLGALIRLALERPVLLIAEDLHWADEGSLAMLLFVSRNTRGSRMLIIGSSRPERGSDMQKTIEKMEAEGLHSEIQLAGLSSSGIEGMAGAVLGGPISEELTAELSKRCEGNPLFAKELMGAGHRDGSIVEREGTWVIRPGSKLASENIEELISRRLRSFHPSWFHALDLCSCLGREFSEESLAGYWQGDMGIAVEAISPLLSNGILRRDGSRVIFRHALVHEVAYKSVGHRKYSYHGRIAESLEMSSEGTMDRALYDIASHYGRSDGHDKSVEYNGLAGDKAVSEGSPGRAAEFYEVAISSLSHQRIDAAVTSKRANLLERKGDACTIAGIYEEALAAYGSAASSLAEDARASMLRKRAEVMDKQGRFDEAMSEFALAEGTVADGNGAEWGRMAISKAAVLMGKGDYDAAIALVQKAENVVAGIGGKDGEMERARGWNVLGISYHDRGVYDKALEYYGKVAAAREKLADERGLYQVHNNIGILEFNKGNYDGALGHMDEAAAIVERMGDQQGLAVTLNNAGLVHFSKGDCGKARDVWERCSTIFERIGDQHGMGASRNNAGIMQQYLGEYSKALELLFKSLETRERIGDKRGVVGTTNSIAEAYRDSGDCGRALEFYDRSIAACQQVGDKQLAVTNLCGRAEARLQMGMAGGAEEDIVEATRLGAEVGEKVNDFWLERIRGMAAREKGDFSEAERRLGRALAGQKRASMALEVAKTEYEIGLTLARKGETGKARTALNEATDAFRKQGMMGWVAKCFRAIERLGV